MLAYIMLLFVFDVAIEASVEEVEVTEQIDTKAGFNKFVSDITPIIEDTASVQRTVSKLEIINSVVEEAEQEQVPQSDIDLLATIVRAEAGNQPLEGKRAVADVILNRVDSDSFPDTIEGVLYQDGQFSCVHDGNFVKALSTKDETDYKAVELELEDRTYDSWVFFRTGGYSSYGEPAGIIGDHYFSKEKENVSNENEKN